MKTTANLTDAGAAKPTSANARVTGARQLPLFAPDVVPPVPATPAPLLPAGAWARCSGMLVKRGRASTQQCPHTTRNPDGLCGWDKCVPAPAEALFETDVAPIEPVDVAVRDLEGRSFWLTDLRRIFVTIGAHPAFLDAMESAAFDGRGSVKDTESEVADALADTTLLAVLLAAVAAETEARPFRTLAPLVSLTFSYLEDGTARRGAGGTSGSGERDRAGADMVGHLTFADSMTLDVPINIKSMRVGGSVSGSEAMNRRALFHGLRGGDIETRTTNGQSPSRDLLDLYAGTFEPQPFDYYLLVLTTDKATGKLYNVRWQGLLSTETENGDLALTPHPTRPDTLGFTDSDRALSDEHDLSRSLLRATNRTPDRHQLGLAVLTWHERVAAPDMDQDRVRTLAGLLRGCDEAALSRATEAFMASLEAAAAADPDRWTEASEPVQLDLFTP